MMIPKPKHKRRVPIQRKRNSFDRKTRNEALESTNGLCLMCNGKATQIHHVKPRGRSGRGVITNAMPVCNSCHLIIHKDNSVLDYWIDVYKKKYGNDFYKDRWD